MIKNIVLFFIGLYDYIHQKKIITFLKKKKIDNLNIFFDVGAHEGESINLFLKNLQIKKIISFEASPINYKKLMQKQMYFSKKFKDTEIIIENIALGSINKTVEFNQFKESSSSTINKINRDSRYFKRKFRVLNFSSSKKDIYKTIQINVEILKDYLLKNNINKVDFLKIDTEGYEYEVLKGLQNKIQAISTIMFEHHYDNMLKKNYTFFDINNLLLSNNFKQIYKSRMPFRKTFEYIYIKNT